MKPTSEGGYHVVKSKYESHVRPNLEEVTKWVKEGDTEMLIAKRLGVGNAAWFRYKNNHEELREAIIKGDQEFGLEIRTALRKRAIGYEYSETTVTEEQGTNGVKASTKVVTKHVAPDVSAIALYMKFAGMLADEELKRAQIAKIKAETAIMQRTGQLDVEDKVGQYLEALEGEFTVVEEEKRPGGGMSGIVKTNPLMTDAASVESDAIEKYGSQFEEEEGIRVQNGETGLKERGGTNVSLEEQREQREQNALDAKKLLENENNLHEEGV